MASYVRNLDGGNISPQLQDLVATGVIAIGDLAHLAVADGVLTKAPGGTGVVPITHIVNGQKGATGTNCLAMPLLPGTVIRLAVSTKTGLIVGKKFGITTGQVLDISNTTQTHFKVVALVYDKAGTQLDYADVVSLDWLA